MKPDGIHIMFGDDIILETPGDIVQFRNLNSQLSLSETDYFNFKTKTETTQNYEHVIVYGNIQSLLNFSDECPDYCFYKLFYGCWNLTSDNLILPAMKVGNYSYSNLFYLNQTLTKLPQLPATEIRNW